MGVIWTIAKRDFLSMLYSPRAGGLFFGYLMIGGLFFHDFVENFVQYQSQSVARGGSGYSLGELIQAIFYNLNFFLIFIVPAITMASFAEEKRHQSYRLLLTVPISSLEIVLGKYFGALLLMLIPLGVLATYPVFLAVYGNPDTGVLLTSFLGFVLTVSSYVAFGLWISSLTNSPGLAFFYTALGLIFLSVLNWFAGNLVGQQEVFETVLQYLAFSEHVEPLFKGLIRVGDISYFGLFVLVFLFFTHTTVEAQRWR